MRVGWIGFGEAASGIAAGLISAGLTDMIAYDLDARRAAQRVAPLGITLKDSLEAVVEESDLLLVATPGHVAEAVARSAAPHLRPGLIYGDCTTTSPAAQGRSARAIAARGGLFVDAALMDAVPLRGHAVPILASGPGSRRFAEMLRPFGMQIEVLEGEPGTATAVKLVRSIFMKGLAAITIETLIAARVLGLGDLVVASLRSTLATPFDILAERLVVGTVTHAGRRVHEMDAALGMLAEQRLQGVMTAATRTLLERASRVQWDRVTFEEALQSATDLFRT